MQRLVDRGSTAPGGRRRAPVVGMLSDGDLIVQEAKLHFPTVITFLGGHLAAEGTARVRGGAAQALGREGRRGDVEDR